MKYNSIACMNGKFVDMRKARISPRDFAVKAGLSPITNVAGVEGKLFFMQEHADRILHGAKKLGLNHNYDAQEIVSLAQETYFKNDIARARITVMITAGEGAISIYDIGKCVPNLVIMAEKLEHAEELKYSQGFSIKSVKGRRIMPDVKHANYLPSYLAYNEARDKGFDDAVFVDHGYVREGVTSNIFIVDYGGEIATPQNGMLEGITRKRVFEIAQKFGMKVVGRAVKIAQLREAKEAFITSTTKKILGVTGIDGNKIGDGKVGEVTQKLMNEFSKRYY